MNITDLLDPDRIRLDQAPDTKADALDTLTALMAQGGAVTDLAAYRAAVLAREAEGSTGIGEGIAIPHAKTPAVARPALAAMTVPGGVEFDALDGEPSDLFFLIAAPDSEDNVHLDVLSRLSVLLMDPEFHDRLLAAPDPASFLAVIDQTERAKAEASSVAAPPAAPGETRSAPTAAPGPAPAAPVRLLAVTACPTGIAHTYMAAEKLEQAARARGLDIKVETDGSGGVKNALTAQDVAGATAVIVAADKDVAPDRFDGLPVVFARVADGIHKPDDLIDQALSGNTPVHRGRTPGGAPSAAGAGDSIGRKVYKALMNGVSHMLPFVIGGGILIALAFLFDSGNAGAADFGSGNDFSRFLKQVGDLAFGMMFPLLAGFIALAVGDRPALMVGVVGGLIAKTGVSITLPEDQWVSSGFFGALIAGFAAGLIVVGLRKLLSGLPASLEGTKPVLLYPLLGILAIGALMVFVVNPPMALFNTWLNDTLGSMATASQVLLGLLLGGMMSIDFGGPINKAAYVFGVASIASGNPAVMAAVMAGGMVPPLALSLSTAVFRGKYTKDERKTTITNAIMGCSFITEGAIPFAASDPLRVIPCCVVGSATAGALSMAFGCASPAPHGGVFVVALISHPLLYILAVVIGAAVSGLALGLVKKPVPADA
ncbi:MAG: fructose-specific PTS transporter subunit EIIC [Propionibacteriaceae bacterium]|jgi:PTS system fructose-specific IIC component|nr:fructose-specific PTS transporter subunit EIIC [Propionibacteriaceae bacterium]